MGYQSIRATGFALALLGAAVMVFHATESAWVARLAPQMVAMVFHAALCFAVLGICLLLVVSERPGLPRLASKVCIAVFIFALLVLAENVLDRSFGLDLPRLHTWLKNGNRAPGRMAPNSAVCFALASLSLWLTLRGTRAVSLRIALVLSFLVGMLGMTGVAGYTLDVRFLYSWFSGARMSLPTAIGMMVLSFGLWCVWRRRVDRESVVTPDERITLVGSLVLLSVALSTGVVGFVTLQQETEAQIARGLSESLRGRKAAFEGALAEGQAQTQMLSTNPAFLARANQVIDRPEHDGIRRQFKAFVATRFGADLRYVSLRTPAGEPLVEIGVRSATKALRADIDNAGTQLLWDDEYLLANHAELRDEQSRTIAILEVVRVIPRLEGLIRDGTGFGRTGELSVCVLKGKRLLCFPNRGQPAVYEAPYIPTGSDRRPMSVAVGGHEGILYGRDYQGVDVIAAYSGLPWPGMGMVFKQDTAEIYEPITRRLKQTLPLLLLLTGGGIFLLRAQVRPLAMRLVRSEAQARDAHAEAVSQEQRIRAILHNIGDGIVAMDADGKIQAINPAGCRIFGYTQEELVGQKVEMLMPPEMRRQHAEGLKSYLGSGVGNVVNKGAVVLNGLRKSGKQFPIELSVSEIAESEHRLFIGVVRDVSERVAAQQALNDEKERLRTTLHSIGDAVITINTQGRVTYLNPVAETMTGWLDEEAYGKPIEDVFRIVDDATGEPADSPVEAVLQSGEVSGLPERTELVRRDGTRIAIEDSAAPIRSQDGRVNGIVIVFHDVTQARKMAAEISYQATHDVLTDLLNRREFERRVSLAVTEDDDNNRGLSLLYLDLDQFKLVNDTCGHIAGDSLLKQLAFLIRGKLRSEDVLARLGGDEFAILLNNCPAEVAARIADLIRQTVRDFLFVWDNKNFSVGVSIGLVTRENGESLADLLKAADGACYLAKEKGRNRVHIYKREDVDLLRRQGEMGWVARIEHALRENQFRLFLQPIVCLDASHLLDHYEVLLRMLDEEGNFAPPMAFIPAAERYGLMPRIDQWVVENALRLMEERQAQGMPIALSINLSGTSINQENFLPFLQEQLSSHSLDHGNICFEITETAAIANLTQSSRMMHEVKNLGCRFSLDDFGSGMSSFAYLKHLPVDYVKIDGSFVRDITEDRIDRAMVSAINNIAHVMGIQTIAEFVESEEILRQLREMGVDYAQGYALGRPFPAQSLPVVTTV